MNGKRLYLAVSGDTHGREDLLFEELGKWEKEEHEKIDAVLLLGDLDSVIGTYDSQTEVDSVIADYCYRKRKPPYQIFFIAGNMDEWTILEKFRNGGKLRLDASSPSNVYFLGRAGVIDFEGIRIGGLSGVYKHHEYEKPLTDESNLWWQYYRRNELEWLMKQQMDILLLHTWIEPLKLEKVITKTGVSENSNRRHRGNRNYNNHLGELVRNVQPQYVFMGHRHTWYVEGEIGRSKIFGLMQLNESTIESGHAYKIISIEPNC